MSKKKECPTCWGRRELKQLWVENGVTSAKLLPCPECKGSGQVPANDNE